MRNGIKSTPKHHWLALSLMRNQNKKTEKEKKDHKKEKK